MVYEFTATDDTAYFFGLHLVSSDDYRYVLNAHGDVIALVSKTGSTISKYYEYDAFGNEINPDSSDTNPYRYCGEYYDFESGTIYLRARYYSPTHGRFTQVDSARDGLNWYAYCYNNPVSFVDPSGEIAVAAVSIFAVIDAVSGAVIATAVTAAAAVAVAATYDIVTKIVEIVGTKTDSATKVETTLAEVSEKSKRKEDSKDKQDSKQGEKNLENDGEGKKYPSPPSKLKDGDKVKTPDSHPDEFKKDKRSNSYTHDKTGWKAQPHKGDNAHGGNHWDMSPPSGRGHINVGNSGNVFGGSMK